MIWLLQSFLFQRKQPFWSRARSINPFFFKYPSFFMVLIRFASWYLHVLWACWLQNPLCTRDVNLPSLVIGVWNLGNNNNLNWSSRSRVNPDGKPHGRWIFLPRTYWPSLVIGATVFEHQKNAEMSSGEDNRLINHHGCWEGVIMH